MSDPPYDLAAYDYQLPEELIAQEPQSRRDQSRLLVVNGGGRGLEDWRFAELPRLVAPGEVMVINDTRVFPARLLGRKESGEGKPFFMTILALKMAYRSNAVSRLHGEVSRRMWREVWKGFDESDIPIGHVTNGAHVPSYIAPG